MSKFQYCKVNIINNNNRDAARITALVLKPDGKHEEFFNQPKGADCSGWLFARLGEAGWEMVSSNVALHSGNAMSDPGKNGEKAFEYIFKREI